MSDNGAVMDKNMNNSRYMIEPESGISIRQIVLLAFLCVAVFCAAFAIGNIVLRDRQLDKVFDATSAEDIGSLINLISWGEFRENVKEDIGKKIVTVRNNGRSPAPVTNLSVQDVNRILEYYIQPESVEILLRIKRGYAPELSPTSFLKRTGFNGLTGFKAVFTHPDPRHGNMFIRSQEVTVYFELRGTEWKIVDADIPLVFVPAYIPEGS